jgi:hypothetical protein
MSLVRCFDDAFPPVVTPAGAGAVLGYIGGQAEHVWTLEEWDRFAQLRQYPCYVCAVEGETDGTPLDSGNVAADLTRELGWNYGRAIIGDMETSTDAAYWRAWSGRVRSRGYVPVAYGSLSAVVKLGAEHLWIAEWDDDPVLLNGRGCWAHQFYSTSAMDWSVLAPELVARGGAGPRRAPGTTTT